MIENEEQVTGEWATQHRAELGQSQTTFWGVAYVSKGMASAYENGRPVPKQVRRLMFLHYVVGVPLDADPKDIRDIARLAKSGSDAVAAMRRAYETTRQANEELGKALETINQQEG